MKILRESLGFACLAVALAACSRAGSEPERHAAAGASAELRATQGNAVKGTVTFTQEPDGVRVKGALSGLTPGKHGFHVHANGDCSAPDASSAGDHFNATGAKHGAPEQKDAHTGDMGNVEADDQGNARIDYVDRKMSLAGATSVVGKAVIVHEKVDDLTSQPTGDSGARIACGVIERGDASADASAH
jgi:Cu-Zn family superoxide dismutase